MNKSLFRDLVYAGDRRDRRRYSPLRVGYPDGNTQMSKKPSRPDVVRCRAGMAKLLTKAVEITRRLERSLGVTGGWDEATAQIELDADRRRGAADLAMLDEVLRLFEAKNRSASLRCGR